MDQRKLQKTGNSATLTVSKSERELLGADFGDKFETQISPDGRSITFTKIDNDLGVTAEALTQMEQLMKKNAKLMELLKDK